MLLLLNACAARADLPARVGFRAMMAGAMLTDDAGQPARPRASGIDPYAALERSAADRARWAMEPATDYASLVWKPIPLKSAELARAPLEPRITAGIDPARTGAGATHPALEEYAVPKAGAEVAKPICSGC